MKLITEPEPVPLSLSVIICTRNRADVLRLTLARLCACEQPSPDQWELIVIDNNSNDDTKKVIESFNHDLPVHYDCVTIPGKTHALNRALQIARADKVIFLDDDVLPDWRLLRVYLNAFNEFSDVNLFGGRIDLSLPEKYDRDLVALPQARLVLPQSNFGRVTRRLEYPETPAGPNMAIRRSGLGAGLRFEFTPLPGYGFTVEDTLFFKRHMQNGHSVVYLPAASVSHIVRPEQLNLDYFRERYCFFKLAQPLMDDAQAPRTLFSVPRYLFRSLAMSAIQYAFKTFRDRRTRLCAYLDLMAVSRAITYHHQRNLASK